MGTKPASSIAVLEVLTDINYEDWSVRVKTYLQAQDLWDCVITEKPPQFEVNRSAFKEWNKKNIMALHVIQISCGPNTFSEIRNIKDSAKDAWKTLEEKYKSKHPESSSNTESRSPTNSGISFFLSQTHTLNHLTPIRLSFTSCSLSHVCIIIILQLQLLANPCNTQESTYL